MTTFPHLFEPIELGGLEIRNRIIFGPHGTSQGRTPGTMPDLVAYHAARAQGGVGLIITEAHTVHESYEVRHNLLAVSDDDAIPELREMADVAHKHGARMFGQLFHPGRSAAHRVNGALLPAYAPSEVPDERHHVMPAPMSLAMIRDIIRSYGEGARRMAEAGLDGIEYMISMGYLPAQFVNPRANLRTDDYGGSFENRLRFVRESLAAIRACVDSKTVVGIRISVDELDHGGLSPEESSAVSKALADEGLIDYVNVIGGSGASVGGAIHIVPPMFVDQAYLADPAARLKQAVGVPTMLGGRINQPQTAEKIVASGQADMVCLVRALIADPFFAAKAARGRAGDIRACIACNQACIGHRHMGAIVSCIQHPETGRERSFPHAKTKAATIRKVMVIGGGPGGMKAAAIAGERGHDVTLYEKDSQLGGQTRLAQMLPGRAEFGGIITNLAHEMEQAGVKVRKGMPVDLATVSAEAPDVVIVATGAVPYLPSLEDLDEAHAVDAWSVIKGEANVGGRVVIADWRCDWVGMGVAEMLARNGCHVRLYCQGVQPGQNLQAYLRDHWIGVLDSLGVETRAYTRLFGAESDSVFFQHMTNGEALVAEEVDTLVLAQGHRREASLHDQLAETWAGELHLIGDALVPRTAEEAVMEGLQAAMVI
ncbi:MAG: FAD-dependent oxidoreductase [Alphaproteobacteria bacterium]|jgi:2,4-dienoyl-CoA reductase-like NADH-dependent reductase (Old Yellow Enzyme family)|nr:FAD-dependent oxidoreductase [Rhodospirillaceae bacterium]MBT7612097.1 FAD-dependent oxidoreductase [Rhodospirillaceae bacterium]MDG2481212.1 FAD-dependent oxidoreductase [Alphaproteobacteria bacterium]